MSDLEYLIIFKSYGIPIYSRCFGHFCSNLMRDDVLLSGFLSALTTIGKVSENADFDKIQVEGEEVNLHFSKSGDLISMSMGDTKLYFFYVKHRDYYIVAGFPVDGFVMGENTPLIQELFNIVEELLDNKYLGMKWDSITKEEFEGFERDLLKNAISPWMSGNKGSHVCILGENCPLRIAVIESKEKSIGNRIKETILSYRKKNMFSKMRMMMSGMKERILPSF